MTTPHERTKAMTDARELLQMLASAKQITIDGLVQSVALGLLRHYPLDVDLDVSAAALPGIWAAPKHQRAGGTAASECQKSSSSQLDSDDLCDQGENAERTTFGYDNFPREPTPGNLPGAQPKLLVREMNGRYYTVLLDEEVWRRHSACEDFSGQLAEYASRKMSASGLSLDDALRRVEKSLEAKVGGGQWDFSRSEMAWLMRRTRELVLAVANGAGGENANN